MASPENACVYTVRGIRYCFDLCLFLSCHSNNGYLCDRQVLLKGGCHRRARRQNDCSGVQWIALRASGLALSHTYRKPWLWPLRCFKDRWRRTTPTLKRGNGPAEAPPLVLAKLLEMPRSEVNVSVHAPILNELSGRGKNQPAPTEENRQICGHFVLRQSFSLFWPCCRCAQVRFLLIQPLTCNW